MTCTTRVEYDNTNQILYSSDWTAVKDCYCFAYCKTIAPCAFLSVAEATKVKIQSSSGVIAKLANSPLDTISPNGVDSVNTTSLPSQAITYFLPAVRRKWIVPMKSALSFSKSIPSRYELPSYSVPAFADTEYMLCPWLLRAKNKIVNNVPINFIIRIYLFVFNFFN